MKFIASGEFSTAINRLGPQALIGITSEFLLSGKAIKIVQVLIYVSMGWSCTFEFDNLSAALPSEGSMLLLAGGVVYTCGIIFYILDKLKKLSHAHSIWHFFVLFGSILHFISIIGYIQ